MRERTHVLVLTSPPTSDVGLYIDPMDNKEVSKLLDIDHLKLQVHIPMLNGDVVVYTATIDHGIVYKETK